MKGRQEILRTTEESDDTLKDIVNLPNVSDSKESIILYEREGVCEEYVC